jgi:hypothetical protein
LTIVSWIPELHTTTVNVTADLQELMIDSKHLKDQQDIVDAFNIYLSSISDKISKNNADSKINYENLLLFIII